MRRKLGLVLAFLVFGLVAGASGLAVFLADLDRDPKHAMALAPAETLHATASSIATVQTEAVEATSAQKPSKAAGIKSPCRESIRENSAADCTSGQKHKPHSILAVNERPAIAAVPIGHRDDPTVLPSEPAAPVVAVLPKEADTLVPAETPVVATLAEDPESATPAETPSTVPTPPISLPAVISTKTRGRHRERAQRHEREHHEYASTPRYHRENREYASTTRYYGNRQVYQSAGYARLW